MTPVTCAAVLPEALGLWMVVEFRDPQMLAMHGLSGCHATIPRAATLRLAGSWEAQLLLDLIVFGLTIYGAYRDRVVIQSMKGSLIERITRDGVTFFGIILLANLANLLTIYLGNPVILVDDLVRTDVFLALLYKHPHGSRLSVTLICRLIINLHRVGDVQSQTGNYNTSWAADILFREWPALPG
ncbi:hypothetical protein K438DRAFT_1967568 [Mycena galopus ATCC 62051]|nr:hypothetical protein K438DRAFT_1967568 [Mycena galopus ATCC 62051]